MNGLDKSRKKCIQPETLSMLSRDLIRLHTFLRQYRTKIVRQMRRQIFRQMKQKAQ